MKNSIFMCVCLCVIYEMMQFYRCTKEIPMKKWMMEKLNEMTPVDV